MVQTLLLESYDRLIGGFTDIVVGAGASGSVIAARLVADERRRVLLAEAGPDYPDPATLPPSLRDGYSPSLDDHDWGLSMTGTLDRRIAAPRGRVVGGSSLVNSCVALRPDPEDFDEWTQSGNPGWSWRDVLPHFVKLEHDHDFSADYHGRSGPIPIRRWCDGELLSLTRDLIDACAAEGFPVVDDLNRPGAAGVGVAPMNIVNRVRVSTAQAYLTPVRDQPNLTVAPDTTVNRVLIRAGRARGVEMVTPTGPEVVEADCVTLCAGAYGTPAILLRSGIGPAEQLRALGIEVLAELRGVGAHLRDHSQCFVAVAAAAGSTGLDVPCLQGLLRFTAPGSEVRNDMQLCILNHVDIPAYAPVLAGVASSDSTFMICPILQKPRCAGSVQLADADPFVPPAIILDYGAKLEDLRRHREGMRLAWKLARGPHLARHVERIVNLDATTVASDAALDRLILDSVRTAHHPVGTAKMGPASDGKAVVDCRCRVHGIERLRVADASIMPTIVRSNTHLTCVMIGERAAEWLLEEP